MVFPLASVPVRLMVLPETDATEPRTQAGLAGAGEDEPGGGVLLAPPGVDSCGLGQTPLTDSLILTFAAVTGCPGADPSVGFTLTQLPWVTSGRPAGTASVILVVEVKFTAAVALSSLMTWMELPATDAIRPLTLASALGVVDEGAAEVTVEVDVEVEVEVELDLFEDPQADRDKAVAPATANTAKRVSRGTAQLADINVSPFVGESEGHGLPI
nr:hypothetical protein [Mycobacterium sp. 852002-10029_SCH5224772]